MRLTGLGNRGSTFQNLRNMVDTTLLKMNSEPPPEPVSRPNLKLQQPDIDPTNLELKYLPPGNP